MIKIYYTTPEKEGVEQIRPILSLGGFRASNTVPNDDFGNLFGEITSLTIERNKEEYRALVIVNEGTSETEEVTLWFEQGEDDYAEFEISAVAMVQDDEGEYFMEQVNTIYSKPMYSEFHKANGEEYSVSLGRLQPNTPVGIWIKRNLNLENIERILGSIVSYDQVSKTYKENSLPKSESIGLVIDF